MSTPNTHFGAERLSALLDPSKCKKIFFCGVGGVNMSSLAHLALRSGYAVVGSDRSRSDMTEALARAGAVIHEGHAAHNVDGCDAFVYTVAISEDNPEYLRAAELKIPRISRADFLGYVMTESPMRIGICGTHGKSTCTAMCSAVFSMANADPTVMCGSVLSDVKSTFKLGGGDHFIFEACEYMDSFLDFNPTAAVVLNVELDHVDYFNSIEQMVESYAKFVKKTGESGTVIYNADDRTAVESIRDFGGRRISFGIESSDAFFRATDIESTDMGSRFTLLKEGKELARISLSVPGMHNVLNALAATAAGYYGGIDINDIVRGLGEYRGTHRRIEYKGRLDGARIYDDYAHHPTEITASLGALRALMNGEGRLSVVFQSHTYSRTRALEDEFASALSLADRVIVAPIFPARETDTLGVSQYTLAAKIKGGVAAESLESAAEMLACDLSEKDVAVVMGAGNVDSIFAMLGDKIKQS